MAKVKVINNNLDSNLNGINFNNTASETIFSFGSFAVTSNFDGRKYIDYRNELSSFVRAVTLETMGANDVQSEILYTYSTNAVLNLDKSDLNTFIRYGSAYEFLRTSIEDVILKYPGSLFVSSQVARGGNITFSNFSYDSVTDESTFRVPTAYTVNTFGLVFNLGNTSTPDDNELKNLNLSYAKYIVWNTQNQTNNLCSIIGFTGYTTTNNYIRIKTTGNPFPTVTGTSGSIDFHIKPDNVTFEEFRSLLPKYESYIVSERDGANGFQFTIKDPKLLDDGNVVYTDNLLLWNTSDKYNIDINTPNYQTFLESLLTIGAKYDTIKTDLIARFLTPASIKTYDLTEEGKMLKLLRIYGREFDELRQFIDSLVYINRVTYDKINNIPDQLVKNLARTFGWNYFSLVNETELVDSLLTIDENERNLNTDLLPAEIDIELWRRILLNTSYFWKSKGTRDAIKSMFLLIGIPEPFINITEYVYTVEGKINPNTVPLTQADFPTNSLPYDNNGYPVAPLETNDFYFQISGDTDSGQHYLDVFRMAGFNLMQTVDNKKSWIQTGATTRVHYTTPQYFQEDSKLVINTKEVDIALDTARGIEFDVFDYIKYTDFPANSSGFTLPFSYVNISLGVSASQVTFPMPAKTQGDFEVRFNGILLNAPKTGTTTGVTYQADYSIDYGANTFTLLTASAHSTTSRRDVIQATYVYSGTSQPVTGITVQYIVTRIKANLSGTEIPLPSMPRGDVQVTINGIALTKGTSQFTADYIVDPNNTTGSSKIIIQNPDVISYLAVNPDIQVAYIEVQGSNDISARSEVVRIDSFSTGKVYYNSGANKFVYKLNYKTNNTSDVKVLIDGIALEPGTDYSLNVSNPYEIFLPKTLTYGNVISVYYLVGGNAFFNPVVGNNFGLGDISQLSFLEFIELIQRRMINARTRKIVSDFKGGWYPTLLNIYIQYLKRSELPANDPLLSNGYTFENLYSFLSKYNAFFQRFVDQLLAATIILRKSGLMIRNSVFTKQKFTYKRGVNLYATGSTTFDMRGKPMVQYLGDDGSQFVLGQEAEPAPIVLHVDTKFGTPGTLGPGMGFIQSTGGLLISGYTNVTNYGMAYRDILGSPAWLCSPNPFFTTPLSGDSFLTVISNLTEGANYLYKAVVKAGTLSASGDTFLAHIPVTPPPPPPSLKTKAGTPTPFTIGNTGGINIVCWEDIQWYGMQYRPIGSVSSNIFKISPTGLTYTSAGGLQNVSISGSTSTSFVINKAPAMSWITTEAPEPLLPTGILHGITASVNAGSARNGLICYTPITGVITGATKCVCVTQSAPAVISKAINICSLGSSVGFDCGCLVSTPSMTAGQCYLATLCWCLCKGSSTLPESMDMCILCNGATIYSCAVGGKTARNCNGTVGPRCVDSNDNIVIITEVDTSIALSTAKSSVCISTISGGVGTFTRGTPCCQITCGNTMI